MGRPSRQACFLAITPSRDDGTDSAHRLAYLSPSCRPQHPGASSSRRCWRVRLGERRGGTPAGPSRMEEGRRRKPLGAMDGGHALAIRKRGRGRGCCGYMPGGTGWWCIKEWGIVHLLTRQTCPRFLTHTQVQQVHIHLRPCHAPGSQGGGACQGRQARLYGSAVPDLEGGQGRRPGGC